MISFNWACHPLILFLILCWFVRILNKWARSGLKSDEADRRILFFPEAKKELMILRTKWFFFLAAIKKFKIQIRIGCTVIRPIQHFRFLLMIEHVMPLCLTISWVYSVAMLVQNIVYEKEQRLKEVNQNKWNLPL